MQLLHIVGSPRPPSTSNTLRISYPFLERLRSITPDLHIETVDLYEDELPAVAGMNIDTKYALMKGLKIDPGHKPSWDKIERLIAQFLAADIYLISTPMWNFSIPYALKYYIDAVVQPGYLFAYNETGAAVGLCCNKTMVCITTRGGDYSAGGPMHAFDQQEPYLRSIFGFVGITDVHFIHAQPMDILPDLRETAIASATEAALALADRLAPSTVQLPEMSAEPVALT